MIKTNVKNYNEGDIYEIVAREQSFKEWSIFISPLIKKANVTHGDVCDIGCGTGIGALVLRTIGRYTIDGIDKSTDMLDYARKSKRYRAIYKLDMASCDNYNKLYNMIICGFDGFNYIPPMRRLAFFTNTRKMLSRNGYFVFDSIESAAERIVKEPFRSQYSSESKISFDQHFNASNCETIISYRSPIYGNLRWVHRQYYASESKLNYLLSSAGFRIISRIKEQMHLSAHIKKVSFLCRAA